MEMVDTGQEVAHVGHVSRNVVLGPRVKVGLTARHWRGYALIFFAQSPPGAVVMLRRHLSGVDLPAPLVDEQAEGQEGDLVQSRAQQQRNIGAGRRSLVDEAQFF